MQFLSPEFDSIDAFAVPAKTNPDEHINRTRSDSSCPNIFLRRHCFLPYDEGIVAS
jgi:hypothetical protein